MTASPGRRNVSTAVLLAVCASLGVLAVRAADDGMVYYRTPTEVMSADRVEGSVRVGGLVVSGSVAESSTESTLLLTDGATQVEVNYPGRLPDIVREGEGAVVEGRWGPDGVLRAEELLLRHSNEYRSPQDVSP